jgi:opacity protein-like surface antigen
LRLPILLRITICLLTLSSAPRLRAQGGRPNLIDLSVTYVGERSLKANTSQNFWMQGGAVELGVDAWRGWGITANVTGTHAGSIGTSGLPLSLVTITFGPRYRWRANRRVSVYMEGLIGEADGLRSIFPTAAGTQPDANGFAVQAGGGVDCQLTERFAVRALSVGWSRTQLPNGVDNVQDSLQVGAGLVVRFGG